MRIRGAGLALLAALVALAFPAFGSAAVYEVNTKIDEADKTPGGPCETDAGAGVCSLRAAIEVTNSTTDVADEIKFGANPFSGEDTDIIGLLSPLPTIVDQLTIRGGVCDTDAGVKGPCASAIRAGGALLVVEDDDVEIQGLGLLGAGTAINVTNASKRFVARGNWIGYNLGGFPGVGAVNNIGIYLDPGSDEATIGGLTAADRNVIGGNSLVNLDLEGASDATIVGNYFGVTPQGDELAATPVNIEITDSTANGGIPAENNVIGNTIEGAALTSADCDGGCNVISGATSSGIDLNGIEIQGETPASGPTTVHGNYIGFNAAGDGAIVNTGLGVWAGGADDVTVGDYFSGDANYITGGSQAIVSENGEEFVARGNYIGVGPDGTERFPPGTGIFVLAQSVASDPSIEQNEIRSGSAGVELRGQTGHITGNDVFGGNVGILVKNEPGAGLVAGNHVEASAEFGILVESPDNEIRANEVIGSQGTGIRVRNPPGIAMNGNLIGGSTAEKENVIENSDDAAIEIFEAALEPGSTTEITRNRGRNNGGLFIDLVNGANEGILPPVLSAVTQLKAEGVAGAGATVRVFRKANASAGELHSFLGEAVADGSGNWKMSYDSIPAGTAVAATQTNGNSATSEIATQSASEDPVEACPQSSCPPAEPSPVPPPGPPPAIDTTPPKAKITKGPKAKSKSRTAKFKFKSNEAGSKFRCKLDKGKFKKCKSPKTYKRLKPGKHVFKVRAIDKSGNVSKPAKKKFTVLK